MAIQPSKLSLALLGVVLTFLWGWTLDAIWSSKQIPLPGELEAYWQLSDLGTWREAMNTAQSSKLQGIYANLSTPIPAGKHQVRMEFKYDGGGLAKGGGVSLFVDGQKDGEGRVDMTVPMLFSADETCDLGKETGSSVSPDYGPTNNAFSGSVNWVQIDLEKDDHDHLISPDERFKIAMARQ
jgi:hypothetical protein